MNLMEYFKCLYRPSAILLASVLLSLTSARLMANGPTQDITINQKNASIQAVFKEIERQSDYRFFYNETLLQQANKVSIQIEHASLDEALNACFKDQPLFYTIVDKIIVVKKREQARVSKAAIMSPPAKLPLVKGTVTDDKGPDVGATIKVKETGAGTSTNGSGEFTLNDIEESATLLISSVSHLSQELRLNGKAFIAINLQEKVSELDESLVVAYNTTTQRRNTSAVTVVKGEQIQNLPNRSFDKSLQGLVPGLQITNGTGQPGGGVSNMVLRGISTGTDAFFGSGVRNPLFVIDGVPVTQDKFQINTAFTATSISNPLAQLNPSDIETVTILKDAAAIALYGSKASNGVILVTTKRGRSGKTIFNFHHQTDIASRLKGKVELLSREEYMDILYETYKNTDPSLTDADILADLQSKFPSKADGSFYPESNWFNEIFTDHATTFTNEISMSGGTDKSNFYLNLEYTKQNGVVRKTGYDRKSLRFNFENRPTNWLKLGINTTLSYNIQNYSNPFEGTATNGFALIAPPLNPVRLEDGSYMLNYDYPIPAANPAAELEYNINRNVAYRGLARFYGEIRFLKDFTLASNLGADFMLAELKEKSDPRLFDVMTYSVGPGRISEANNRRANLISTNTLRFDKLLNNEHSINILLGQEGQVITEKGISGEVWGVTAPLPQYDQLSSPDYALNYFGGSTTKQTLLSLFGQANYGYKSKYFLSASIRGDGSSRFGERQQWGTFWSAGAGWVITSESFMKGVANWLNYLKLRGSIGAAGSSAAVSAATRYYLLNVRMYLNNPAFVPGSQPGNPDIQWEQTFNWDAGLEARFLQGRIAVTADIYNRKTSDLIYITNLSSLTGYPTILDNIGDMKNHGVELSLSIDPIRSRNFTWNLNANWSTNQNKLIKANVPLSAITGGLLGNEEGRNFNSFYMRQWAGVDPATGSPQWLDSTGKPNTDYTAAKRQFAGKPQPDGFGAITNTFTYKNFELSVQFYYQYGFKIYNENFLVNDGRYPYANQDKKALDRWKKPGDIAANPKRILDNYDADLISTRHLYSGDYVRLQNATLTYSFPKKITDRLGLSMLQLYVQGHNLALWTKFPGQDPDNANVGGSISLPYPNQRSFSIGLNANF